MQALPEFFTSIPKEVEHYNRYLTFYHEAKSAFVEVARPLIEKILGVYVFFAQYGKNKGMKPSMLVCNATLEMLVKSTNMPRLQVFLDTVNNKNDFRNTVWFGIAANVEYNDSSGVRLTRERVKGNKKVTKTDLNTMADLTSLLQGICDYKVQTFFSFETCEETSFSALATKGIGEYIEKTRVLVRKEYSDYIIPCLPNISIVPKNKSGIILDTLMLSSETGAELSKESKDELKLFLKGIYIPACYVSAGLIAAYQCPDFL